MTMRKIVYKKQPGRWFGYYVIEFYDPKLKKWYPEARRETKWGIMALYNRIKGYPPNYTEDKIIK